jgi:hypothetical protein
VSIQERLSGKAASVPNFLLPVPNRGHLSRRPTDLQRDDLEVKPRASAAHLGTKLGNPGTLDAEKQAVVTAGTSACGNGVGESRCGKSECQPFVTAGYRNRVVGLAQGGAARYLGPGLTIAMGHR